MRPTCGRGSQLSELRSPSPIVSESRLHHHHDKDLSAIVTVTNYRLTCGVHHVSFPRRWDAITYQTSNAVGVSRPELSEVKRPPGNNDDDNGVGFFGSGGNDDNYHIPKAWRVARRGRWCIAGSDVQRGLAAVDTDDLDANGR